MTPETTAVAQTVTSRRGTTEVAYYEPSQCYYRPETEELVFIALDQATDFETHWREMAFRMDAYHQAQVGYSSALEHYTQMMPSTPSAHVTETLTKSIAAAEQKLEKERAAIQEKLGKFSLTGMSYDDVIELIPVAGQDVRGKGGSKPTRHAYVNKAYFTKGQEGRKLHSVSLKSADKKGGVASVYGKDKHGNSRIDTKTLSEQLSTLEVAKLKLELKDVLRWAGSDFDPESLKHDKVLFEWAECWNESLTGSKEVNANIDVSGGAQFMRFASNVGASAEWDVAKGQVAIKAEAQSSLTLASGVVNMSLYVPDRTGWALRCTMGSGQTIDLGMLRVALMPELTGFIGASVHLEGQLQVVTNGGIQVLAGQPGGRLPRFKERQTRGATFHQQMASEDEGLKLTGEGFAGAKVEASLRGALQWLKPNPPPDLDKPFAGLLKSTGKFVDFCSIQPTVAGLAGAGAGGKFHCTFINGRFCFHVAASLCWGMGAKGKLIAEVGVTDIAEFGAWLVYQLYSLDYGFLDIIDGEAFKAYADYCFLRIVDFRSDVYAEFVNSALEIRDVVIIASDWMANISSVGKSGMSASAIRNKVAKNIIANSDELLSCPPEAKGRLLFALTRHAVWDHLDLGNRGEGPIPDIYKDRKEAVICVLRSIQTRNEWKAVLLRISDNGLKERDVKGEISSLEAQEAKLERFLMEGFNRHEEVHKAKRELSVIYDRLKHEPAIGYAFAMNETAYYALNSRSLSRFATASEFGAALGGGKS